MSDEEKKEYEKLKSLLYTGTISQYGKRKLIDIIDKQSKEIGESEQKEKKAYIDGTNVADKLCNKKWEDKIKAKIEELEKDLKEYENGQEWEIQDEIRGQIDILQSLLEKE